MLNDRPRSVLIQIIAQYGPAVIDEPRRVEGLLNDLCGEHKREIKILMDAAHEHVALDLRAGAGSGMPSALLVANLTRRLLDETGLSEENARWAVESWAAALEVGVNPAAPPLVEPVNTLPPTLPVPSRQNPPALSENETRLAAEVRAAEQARLEKQRLVTEARAREAQQRAAAQASPRRKPAVPKPNKPTANKTWRRRLIALGLGLLILLGLLFGGVKIYFDQADTEATQKTLTAATITQSARTLNAQRTAGAQRTTSTAAQIRTLTQASSSAAKISTPARAVTQTARAAMAVALLNSLPACTTVGTTVTWPVDSMILACVPSGKFLMGAANGDTGNPDERPQHEVMLDAFWIDRTEVTNAMYRLCVADGVCREPDYISSPTRPIYYGNPLYDNYPVIHVNWYAAQTYCAWAGRGLPTEAQWEKAARGTAGGLYPWGNAAPDATLLNFNQSIKDTTEVGSYTQTASPYGAWDMAGNVGEWVADAYGDLYYAASTPVNPTGPSSGDYKLARGGSWDFSAWYVRSSYRLKINPNENYFNLGFRCAR